MRIGDLMVATCGRGIARSRPSGAAFGYRRLGIMLAREGLVMNHKKLLWLYREESCGSDAGVAASAPWARERL